MMIRRTVLVVAALVAFAAPTAGADQGLRQGWWTATNPGGLLPGNVTGPDVPADGLLVQGGATDEAPLAVAALAVPVPEGADVRTLIVHAASTVAVVPGSTIKACPLRSGEFAPAQGGPLSEAPEYDCTNAADAPVGADGVTFAFATEGLITDRTVAIALVPGTPTTRVALAKPGGDVLLMATPRAPVGPSAPVAATAPPSGYEPPAALGAGLSGEGTDPESSTRAAPSTSTPAHAVSSFIPDAPPEIEPLAALGVVLLIAAMAFAWARAGRRAVSQAMSSPVGAKGSR